MFRSIAAELRRRLPVVALSVSLAFVLLALSFAFGPAVYAQDLPERDTRTWDDPLGGPSFTFSSLVLRNDCTSRGDIITTTGLRTGWTLNGQVTVRRPDNTGIYSIIQVSQTTDLNLLVLYPPVSEWQDNTSNRELHIDVTISVRDELGNLVTWVGGDQKGSPGVLGPGGQDWDIFCAEDLTPAIEIIKLTNGADANDPNAAGVPLIAPGAPVTWTYRITNTGDVDIPFAEITVTDNILNVTPAFDAVESGDLKGDGNGLLQPGEVWRYTATGVAVNLVTPPVDQGLILVTNVCRGGVATDPGRTAYTNIGTVTIPNMTDTDPSSYCGLPVATLTHACIDSTPTWTAVADTTGLYVVQFMAGTNNVASSINQNLVGGTAATFNYGGTVADLTSVRLLYKSILIAEDIITQEGACPTAAPPSSEPSAGGTIFLPMVAFP